MNTCFHYPCSPPHTLPQAFPSYWSLNLFLSLTFPLPSRKKKKNLCPNCLIAVIFLLDKKKKFPSLTGFRPQLQFKTPQLVTETPPLAASRANPGRTSPWNLCEAQERLHLPVFPSHMDTHTELLLTPHRSIHQLLAKLLLLLRVDIRGTLPFLHSPTVINWPCPAACQPRDGI